MNHHPPVNKELVLTIILQEMDRVFEVNDLSECKRIANVIQGVSPSIQQIFEQVVCTERAKNVNAGFLYRGLVLKSMVQRNDAKFDWLLGYETSNSARGRLFLWCLEESIVDDWTLDAYQTVVNTLMLYADLISAMFLQVSTFQAVQSEPQTHERRQKIRAYLRALCEQHGDWCRDYQFKTNNDFMPYATYLLYITLVPDAQSMLFLNEVKQYLTPADFEREFKNPTTRHITQTPLSFALTRFGTPRMPIITWLIKESDINNPVHNYPLFTIINRSLMFITINDKLIDDLCAALDKKYDWRIQKNVNGRMMTAREYCEHLLSTAHEEETGTMTATEFCEYMLFVSPKSSQIPFLFARLYAWLQSLEIRSPESDA